MVEVWQYGCAELTTDDGPCYLGKRKPAAAVDIDVTKELPTGCLVWHNQRWHRLVIGLLFLSTARDLARAVELAASVANSDLLGLLELPCDFRACVALRSAFRRAGDVEEVPSAAAVERVLAEFAAAVLQLSRGASAIALPFRRAVGWSAAFNSAWR